MAVAAGNVPDSLPASQSQLNLLALMRNHRFSLLAAGNGWQGTAYLSDRQTSRAANRKATQPVLSGATEEPVIDLCDDHSPINVDDCTGYSRMGQLHGSSSAATGSGRRKRHLSPVSNRHHSTAIQTTVAPTPALYYQQLLSFADQCWKDTDQVPKRHRARALVAEVKRVGRRNVLMGLT